jgi:hypothetical protein
MSEKYSEKWYPAYEDLLELKNIWPFQVEDLFGGSGKYPLLNFRYGKGPRRIVFIARVHGHEPAGTSGTIAFLQSLVTKRDERLNNIEDNFTLDIIPMVNVDAALRYANVIPDSYAKNRFEENEEDYIEYKNIMTSPGRDLFNNLDMRENHLKPSTIAEMKSKEIPLGTLYNEQAVEIARDWKEQNARHTKTLTKFMQNKKPEYFIDIHCHERPTTLYVPYTEEIDEDIKALSNCGDKLLNILRSKNIPCTPNKKCTHYVVHGISNDYMYNNLGIKSFLWEINAGYKFPPSFKKVLGEDYLPRSLTRNEMTETVYELMLNFLHLQL